MKKSETETILAEELIGLFGSLSADGTDWIDFNTDCLRERMSEYSTGFFALRAWFDDAIDENEGEDVAIFRDIGELILSHNESEIPQIMAVFGNANSYSDIYRKLQGVN